MLLKHPDHNNFCMQMLHHSRDVHLTWVRSIAWLRVMTRNLFFFFYLTSCITTAVTWLTPFTFVICFCSPMTHSDSLLIHCCDSVLVLIIRWLIMTPYCTLTLDESLTVFDSQWVVYLLLWLLLLSWLIVLKYYKYRCLWFLRPQTWLLVSYGTTAQ